MGSISYEEFYFDDISAIFSLKNEPPQTGDVISQRTRTRTRTRGGLFGMMKNLADSFRCVFQGEVDRLPEDVVLDIVSRLPSEDVLKCRMVCKRWMAMTKTPFFFDLHRTRAPLMILLQNHTRGEGMRLYSLDLIHEQPYITGLDTTKLPLARNYYIAGTCHGLVLMYSTEDFDSLCIYIFSPLTGRVIAEVNVVGYYCGGLWFHPSRKEYLFLVASHPHPGWCYEDDCELDYKIFNLSGESTVIGSYATDPLRDPPVNVSGSLHYLLCRRVPPDNCVMIFNTESEKIDFKPHPHSYHCRFEGHVPCGFRNKDMSLLEVDESLAFSHVCGDMSSIFIWILVDRAAWHWIQRYRINLKWSYRIEHNGLHCVNIQKGEMLMLYGNRLISINLETRRVARIDLSIDMFMGRRSSVISTTYQLLA